MVIIYSFSAKPVDNSNESSLSIASTILSAYENIIDPIQKQEVRMDILESINHVVRKGAHFTEYAVLAISLIIHLLAWKFQGMKLFTISVAISAVYAATDEFHQTFVPGRAGMMKDVLLDTMGAATGALLFLLFLGVLEKRRKNKQN
jgi:VanZ family protein